LSACETIAYEVKKNKGVAGLKAAYRLNFRNPLKSKMDGMNYWRNEKSAALFGRLLKIITMRTEPGGLISFVIDQ
jgi:hypothetical protein